MKKIQILLVTAIIIISGSCTTRQKHSGPVKIAITKTNDFYSELVERNGKNTIWVNLYGMPVDSALKTLQQCDGLLVTGGEDVYPGLYGKVADTGRCEGFDRYRDTLEIKAIHEAIHDKMPVFGICRGLQIINVALGGTLIIDIPTDFDTVVKHRLKNGRKCYHIVDIVPNTMMSRLSGVTSDTVNSAHHQGIENPGKDLLIAAYARDSLPEAIEWADKDDKGFLMATQWHPEHLAPKHPLSKNLVTEFIREAAVYHKNH